MMKVRLLDKIFNKRKISSYFNSFLPFFLEERKLWKHLVYTEDRLIGHNVKSSKIIDCANVRKIDRKKDVGMK